MDKWFVLLLDRGRWLWHRRGERAALVSAIGLASLTAIMLGPSVVAFLGSSQATPTQVLLWTSGFGLAANAFVYVLWWTLRRVPVLPLGTVGILVAPRAQVEAEAMLYQLNDALRRDLKSRGTTSIRVILIASHLIPDTDQERVTLLHRTGGAVLISGKLASGGIRGQKASGFTGLSFSIRHPELTSIGTAEVAASFTPILSRRYFVLEDDSFIERELLSASLTEVARFFVALVLTLQDRSAEALQIWRDLSTLPSSASPLVPETIRRSFAQRAAFWRQEALRQVSGEFYNSHVVDRITRRDNDAAVRTYERLMDEALATDIHPSRWLLNKATCRFHFGDIDGAVALVNQARSKGETSAALNLSAAFLALWTKNYQRALREYYRARKAPDAEPAMCLSVVHFLGTILDIHPDRHEFRFGLAYVTQHMLCDTIEAAAQYRMFLQSVAHGPKAMGKLRAHAERELTAIESGHGPEGAATR